MIKKEFTKTGRSCRVTFIVPDESGFETVALVGDFNNWDPFAHPMPRGKNGSNKVTVSLKPGHAYHFRYLLDGERWENDREADGFVPNPFGGEDSLVMI